MNHDSLTSRNPMAAVRPFRIEERGGASVRMPDEKTVKHAAGAYTGGRQLRRGGRGKSSRDRSCLGVTPRKPGAPWLSSLGMQFQGGGGRSRVGITPGRRAQWPWPGRGGEIGRRRERERAGGEAGGWARWGRGSREAACSRSSGLNVESPSGPTLTAIVP